MKKLRRTISFLLVFALMMGMFPISLSGTFAFAAETPAAPLSGSIGGINWELTEVSNPGLNPDDTLETTFYNLALTGTGSMELKNGQSPWYDSRGQILSVSIADGITSIGNYAFYECASLKSVTLPDSVETIGRDAFNKCEMLEEVILGAGLTDIGENAFYWCINLGSITVGPNIKTIGKKAFYANNIVNVQFEDGLEEIGESAFERCEKLASVSLPDSVSSIGPRAFASTKLKEFTVPAGTTVIGHAVLDECSSLSSIQVGAGNTCFSVKDGILYEMKAGNFYKTITYARIKSKTEISIEEGTEIIDAYSFNGGTYLTNITLPETIKQIGDHAFNNCYNVQEIRIPGNVETIQKYAFGSWEKIVEINIPDSVQTIESNAFYMCESLATVSIGSGLKNLHAYVFSCCSSIASITISDENPALSAVDNVVYNKDCTIACFYPEGKTDKEYTFPDTLEELQSSCIVKNTSLVTLYLPASLYKMNSGSISSNKSLKNIFFAGDAPKTYSTSAIVYNAADLIIFRHPSSSGWDTWKDKDKYTIADWRTEDSTQEEGEFNGVSWQYIGATGCISFTGSGVIPGFTEENPAPWDSYKSGIQTIEISEGITEIGSYTFCQAENLLRMESGADLNSIGDYAFNGCTRLIFLQTRFVENIGSAAFQGDVAIKGDLFFDKVASLGSYAFQGCTSIEDVFLGSHLQALEEEVFAGCTSLSSIFVPETVSVIEAGALKDCTSLHTVNIPASTISIGAQAFSGSTALEKVYFYGEVPADWAADSFTNCSSSLILYYRISQNGWTGFGGVWNGIPVEGQSHFYTENKDYYSFSNSAPSFGYGINYRIPRQRYVDVLQSIITGTYYYVINPKWDGSCYGMAATTLEFYENSDNPRFDINSYDASAETLYEIAAPGRKDSDLTKLIEAYQISQYNPLIAGFIGAFSANMKDYKGLIKKVEEFERSGGFKTDPEAEPVLMSIYSTYGGHAVIPVSVGQDNDGNFILKVYDPSYPSVLQTLRINKDFSGISYGRYKYASYVGLNTISSAMSGVELHNNKDASLYLSIDKENIKLASEAGNTIEDIEGAYEQKHNAGEEETFPGIRSFVLPEGNYNISTDKNANTGTSGGTEESVIFYLASGEYFAEIVSSDKDAVLSVDKETGTDQLKVRLVSESQEEEVSSFTIINQQGMERKIETNSNTTVIISGDDISIEVPADTTISIDGMETAVNGGKAETTFSSSDEENPLKAKEIETSITCDSNSKLSGTANATLISNATASKDVNVTVQYYDQAGKLASSYIEKIQLAPGMNFVQLSFDNLENSLEAEGEVLLSCRLSVEDESGNSAFSVAEGISVTLLKQQGTNTPSTGTPDSTASPAPVTPGSTATPTPVPGAGSGSGGGGSYYPGFLPPVYGPSPTPDTTSTLTPAATPVPGTTSAPGVPSANATGTPEPTASPDVPGTPEPTNTPVPSIPAQPGGEGSTAVVYKKGYKYTDKKTNAIYKITGTGKNKTAEYIKSTKKNPKAIIIPATIKINGISYKVTSIGKKAFAGKASLNKVTIGKNIKKIGNKAFYKCKKLRYINVKSVNITAKGIGKAAFKGIYGKPRVKTNKSVKNKYYKIFVQKGMSEKAKFIIKS